MTCSNIVFGKYVVPITCTAAQAWPPVARGVGAVFSSVLWILFGRQLFKVTFPDHVWSRRASKAPLARRCAPVPAASVSAPAECF